MTRTFWAWSALLLVACGSEDTAARAPQGGPTSGTGGAGKPSLGASGGDGMTDDDAGTTPGGSTGAVCPPAGRYRRTLYELDTTSDPRCMLTSVPQTRFFGPITDSHEIVLDGVRCTVLADEVSNDGCALRRRVSCDDGRSSDSQCEVSQLDGVMRCTESDVAAAIRCVANLEYVQDEAFKGECDAIEGPYQRSSQRTAGNDLCPLLNDQEIVSPAELALDPACVFSLPDANGSCMVNITESCAAGEGAMHACTVEPNASRVTCKVARDDCTYDVTLVR